MGHPTVRYWNARAKASKLALRSTTLDRAVLKDIARHAEGVSYLYAGQGGAVSRTKHTWAEFKGAIRRLDEGPRRRVAEMLAKMNE